MSNEFDDSTTVLDAARPGADVEDTGNEDRGDVVIAAAPANEPASSAAPDDVGAPAPRTDGTIPKARFNEVIKDREDLRRLYDESQRELDAIRRASGAAQPATAAPATVEFDEAAKEREYLDAVMDDDRDKAVAIRREINAHQQAVAVEHYRTLQAFESTRSALDEVTQKALQAYPWLDTPEGNEVLDMIVDLRDRKIQGGTPAHLALSQAVSAIAPRFAPEGQPPGGVLPTTQAPVDTRSAAAVARGAAGSTLQPPALGGTGNRASAGRVSVTDMSDEQFDALSETEKSRLRGDA